MTPLQLDDEPTAAPADAASIVEQREHADVRLLHTPAQAACILTVRESWLRRMAGRREVPCTFVGKHLRFSDSDLDAIVRLGARPAHGGSRLTKSRPPKR